MRIAVVEDDEDIRLLWRVSLGPAEVVEAASLDEAFNLDWLSVDAAIIDFNLHSAGNGVDLFVWLREHHPHVQSLIVTAVPEMVPIEYRDVTVTKPMDIDSIRVRLMG